MISDLVFYSFYGAGDLFNSKGIIKDIIDNVEAERYFYCHNKGANVFKDIVKLKYSTITYLCENKFQARKLNNDIYINTWIGLQQKYVLPGIGIFLDKYIEMFNECLTQTGIDYRLEKNIVEYIPEIDYSFYNTNIVDFIIDKNEKHVLICNGKVNSNQANNFDFEPIINELAINHKDIQFFITESLRDSTHDNIVSTEDLFTGFDLNEIAYISTFCDLIVGRASGPFVFTQTKSNIFNPNKKFLAFTYNRETAYLVRNLDIPSRRFWSNKIDKEGVLKDIECHLV
jgi:hypothetical protein